MAQAGNPYTAVSIGQTEWKVYLVYFSSLNMWMENEKYSVDNFHLNIWYDMKVTRFNAVRFNHQVYFDLLFVRWRENSTECHKIIFVYFQLTFVDFSIFHCNFDNMQGRNSWRRWKWKRIWLYERLENWVNIFKITNENRNFEQKWNWNRGKLLELARALCGAETFATCLD